MRNFIIISLVVLIIVLALRNKPTLNPAIGWASSIWRRAMTALTTGKVAK